jgi:hypothetical protein
VASSLVGTVPLSSHNASDTDCHTCTPRSSGLSAAVETSGLKSGCWLQRRALKPLSQRRNERRGFIISPRAKVATSSDGVGISDVDSSDIQAGLENSFKLSEAKLEGASDGSEPPSLRILIAGGGIGGLVLALAAKNQGLDVTVFERDLSAIRGEGQYRGPIQIQSNALAALEAIDSDVAEQILETGCVTGDRINGLVDGLTGSW